MKTRHHDLFTEFDTMTPEKNNVSQGCHLRSLVTSSRKISGVLSPPFKKTNAYLARQMPGQRG